MHENGGDQSGLESRHQHRDRHVRLLRAEIDVGKSNGDAGEDEQGRADHEVTANMFADVVGVMLRARARIRRYVGRVIHRLEQVKERKNKNPNQINKVPEQPGDLNSVGEMLGFALVNCAPTGSQK